ncbi:MAG: AAA domain-containing protein, partial [Pseudomonadota bacterium]
MRLLRLKGDGGHYYIITGERYKVFVNTKKGMDSSHLLATLSSIKEIDGLPPRGRVRIGISFHPIQQEVSCDIDALYETIVGAERKVQEALRGPLKKDPSLAVSSGLHGEIRKRYGLLRAMFGVLERKTKELQSWSGRATVLGEAEGPDGAGGVDDEEAPVILALAKGAKVPRDLRQIKLRSDSKGAPDEPFRATVRDQDEERGTLALDPVDGWEPTDGEAVRIDAIPRFSMKNHARALQSLLSEEVVGSWEALATLLVDPKALDMDFERIPPDHYFYEEGATSRRLNPEQRAAVAGACSTPHAFFIQGPPGTGKTTVIEEVIRQLVARGERVLMLAPTHVAIDEVLARIDKEEQDSGRQSAVRPLRLSHDDSKIRASLRKYSEAQKRHECLAQLLRRPDDAALDPDPKEAQRHAQRFEAALTAHQQLDVAAVDLQRHRSEQERLEAEQTSEDAERDKA